MLLLQIPRHLRDLWALSWVAAVPYAFSPQTVEELELKPAPLAYVTLSANSWLAAKEKLGSGPQAV